MKPWITYSELSKFAYTNAHLCDRVRGIALSFFGLGNTQMLSEDSADAKRYAEKGVLLVIPYLNPWNWMNPQAVAYVDEVLDVLFEALSLPAETPIVSTGGSMGGLCALVYTAKAKRTPVTCVANCPVCDLPYHYTERPDLPRTLYSAFYGMEGSLSDALRSCSPLHLAEHMPDAEYILFHCTADKAVNKQSHSDKLVAVLQKNHRVTYIPVPERGHCDLTPEAWERYHQAVFAGIEGRTRP